MAHIYISYATQDEQFVKLLNSQLEQFGHMTFVTTTSLMPGSSWRNEMNKALEESDAIVVLISESSVSSKWVMTEIGMAIGYSQHRGKPLIIPVVIDEVPLPLQINNFQAIIDTSRQVEVIAEKISNAVEQSIGTIVAKEQERQESIQRVERNAGEYITSTISELQTKEQRFYRTAYIWYIISFLCLLVGLGIGIYRALTISHNETQWAFVVQYAVINLIIVGLLGAVARFSFILGKAFMVESLRNADRIHAISFGHFYLKAFGDKSEWAEVKEAFQHWNIDKGSAFSNQTVKDIDPEIIQVAIEIAKAINGAKDK
jgi:hypothetical protein